MVVDGAVSKSAQRPYTELLVLIGNAGSVATAIVTSAAVVVQA
jgi:hypothetical protein